MLGETRGKIQTASGLAGKLLYSCLRVKFLHMSSAYLWLFKATQALPVYLPCAAFAQSGSAGKQCAFFVLPHLWKPKGPQCGFHLAFPCCSYLGCNNDWVLKQFCFLFIKSFAWNWPARKLGFLTLCRSHNFAPPLITLFPSHMFACVEFCHKIGRETSQACVSLNLELKSF